MVLASMLELLILFTMAASTDVRTRIVGVCIWSVYLYFSATRVLLMKLAKWLYDINNPPGGAA